MWCTVSGCRRWRIHRFVAAPSDRYATLPGKRVCRIGDLSCRGVERPGEWVFLICDSARQESLQDRWFVIFGGSSGQANESYGLRLCQASESAGWVICHIGESRGQASESSRYATLPGKWVCKIDEESRGVKRRGEGVFLICDFTRLQNRWFNK